MRFYRILLPAVLLLLCILPVSGQYYQTGQDPASVKWLQIRTEKFRIIYPESYGEAGIRFARSLEDSEIKLKQLFPDRKFRIPIVIHSLSTISNGYVSWAPRRMEIYPATEQNAIPGDQFGLLSIHELTHVHQMVSVNTGFTRMMSYLLGEQFTGIVSSLLPLWYLEGGAVLSESVLTSTGRGRTASFQRHFRAMTNEGIRYNFDRILNGSYRKFVPNHYQSGYQMTAWAAAKYDTGIWNRVMSFTGKYPFTLSPVNFSLLKEARLTKKRLYNEAFDSISSIWRKDIPSNTEKYPAVSPEKRKEYINYYSPVFTGKDSIAAIKTSLYASPSIVLINPSGRTEKILHRPGSMYPWYLSYGSGRLVWVETRPDPRWDNRDYSDIITYSFGNGKSTKLTHKGRFMSAGISPDGKEICAIESSESDETSLVLLDPDNGRVLRKIKSPGNHYLQRPRWSADGRKITVIYLTESGEGVTSYSPGEDRWEILIEEGKTDILDAFMRKDSLLVSTGESGIENVYLIQPGGKKMQLTRSAGGATDFDADSRGRLIFTDYSASGFSIAQTSTGNLSLPDENKPSSFLANRFSTPAKSPENTKEYDPEPYREWKHLFRFHSWMPFYADLEEIQSDPLSVRPGFTIMSQNTLSTLIATLGYEYSEDRRHQFHSRITWQGWYPVIQSEIDYNYFPRVFGTPAYIDPGFRIINEVSVPLSFSTGWFSQYLRPSVTSEYTNNIYREEQSVYDHDQLSLTARLFFTNYGRSSLRDIFPPFAQTIDLNYAFSPFDRDILGSSTFMRTTFYFPGFLKNNGIRIRFDWEQQEQAKYFNFNRISFPRGFRDRPNPEGFQNIISDNLKVLNADYVLPLLYPDLSLPGILYIKRIRSGLFYDQAWGKGNRFFGMQNGRFVQTNYVKETMDFTTFGTELLADFHLLRIPFEISGGVQAAWRSFDRKPAVSMLFNIDLYGFSLGRGTRNRN